MTRCLNVWIKALCSLNNVGFLGARNQLFGDDTGKQDTPNGLKSEPQGSLTLHVCLTVLASRNSVRVRVRTLHTFVLILSKHHGVGAHKSFPVASEADRTPHERRVSNYRPGITAATVLSPCPVSELVVEAGFWKKVKENIKVRLYYWPLEGRMKRERSIPITTPGLVECKVILCHYMAISIGNDIIFIHDNSLEVIVCDGTAFLIFIGSRSKISNFESVIQLKWTLNN